VISFRPLADGTIVDVLTLQEENKRLRAELAAYQRILV
jgi:hypothetical protein